MSKRKTAFILLMLFMSASGIPAQTTTDQPAAAFDMTGFPQWAKDLRRFEIVAFGSFPFTMLVATTAMDMYRWNNANGMSFDDMRYAPWPIKSAGAIAMSNDEMANTIKLAAGLSLAVAVTDFIIVQIKRQKARRRAEALPSGTTIIVRTPLPEESPEATEGEEDPSAGVGETSPEPQTP